MQGFGVAANRTGQGLWGCSGAALRPSVRQRTWGRHSWVPQRTDELSLGADSELASLRRRPAQRHHLDSASPTCPFQTRQGIEALGPERAAHCAASDDSGNLVLLD